MTTSEKPAGGGAVRVEAKVRSDAVWRDDRCIELEQLELLLREVAAINKGSGCLQRIEKCIGLANRLTDTDFGSGRASFLGFLRDIAIEDRFGSNT